MTLVERMLDKFSPPLDPSLVLSLSEELSDMDENERVLTETLSNLVQENRLEDPESPSEDQPLSHQVRRLFPDLTDSQIQRAISNNPPDLNDIIDYLQATQFEDAQQHPSDPTPRPPSPPTTRKTKKKKKKTKLNPNSFHINDVRQTGNATRLQQFQQARAPHQVDNVWATGQSQITHLSNLIGIQVGKIYSIYHSKDCNLVLTLEEIFNDLEPSKRAEIEQDADRLDQLNTQLDFLKNILNQHDDESLMRLLIVTDLEPSSAYDLWLFLNDLQDRYGTLPFNQFFFSNPVPPGPSSSSALVQHKVPPISQHQRVVAKRGTRDTEGWIQVSQSVKGSSTTNQLSANQSYNKLKELETKYENTKNRLNNDHLAIGSSSGVHLNKRAIQSSIALIRREDSAKLLKQVKQRECELVNASVLQRQRDRNDFYSIDLHGFTTHQASFITQQFLNSWWDRVQYLKNAYNSDYEPLRIITGAGTHSINATPRLLHTIKDLLNNGRWKWKDEHCANGTIGSLIVYGHKRE